jgi:hypothetical protein
MMRRSFLLVSCCVAIQAVAAGQPCKLPPLTGAPGVPGGGEVRHCAPEKAPVSTASLAILVDDSGSMAGHGAVMPQVLSWFELASSRLAARGLKFSETRGCYFSSARPLGQCKDATLRSKTFQGKGGTTLNEAVQLASQFDLAVIITDGVGTIGGGPACAGGVDAACLAAVLAAALQPRGGEPRGVVPGLWILPLVSFFDGTLFTEQAFRPDQFDAQRAAEKVTADTGFTAAIRNPRTGSDGLLAYDYRGPRMFLAFVIARPAELGRTFLGALAAAEAFSRISPVASLQQLSQGVARLPPIEAFPGIVPRVSGFASAKLDPKACRTLSANLVGPAQFRIDCPNPLDEGTLYLTSPAPLVSSECIVLQSLPAQSPRLVSSDAANSPVKDYRWTGSTTDSNRPFQLSLRLQCRRNWSFPCPKQGLMTSWRVTLDYRASGSRLATVAQSPAERTVANISATSVIDQPHRLLQLREALEGFYRSISVTTPSTEQELARLTICKP